VRGRGDDDAASMISNPSANCSRRHCCSDRGRGVSIPLASRMWNRPPSGSRASAQPSRSFVSAFLERPPKAAYALPASGARLSPPVDQSHRSMHMTAFMESLNQSQRDWRSFAGCAARASAQSTYLAAAAVIAPLLRSSSTAALSFAASSGVIDFEPSRVSIRVFRMSGVPKSARFKPSSATW
jgi:hypothetical protein